MEECSIILQGFTLSKCKLKIQKYCSYELEYLDHQWRWLTQEYVEKTHCNSMASLLFLVVCKVVAN